MTKLSKEQVRKIREIGTKVSTRKLAKRFQCSHVAVFNARVRKTKKDLLDKPCSKCGR